MKRVLLSFFLIACAFFNKVNAQCTISNVSIAPTNVNQSACQVTFDLSYTADLNPGSKYVIVYLWKSSDYTTHTANDYPLPTNQTSTLLGVLIVGNPGKTPVHISTWPADMKKNTEPVAGKILTGGFSYLTNANGTKTYTFSQVTANLQSSGCQTEAPIKGDVWATQNAQGASCMAAGTSGVVVNDPVMNGLLICNSSSQRSFNVSFKTIQPESITFSAYEDANDNGVFDQADRDAGKLNLSGGPNINSDGTSVTVATSANTLLNFGSYQYNPHLTGSKLGVFVAARKSGNNYDNVLLIENSCSSTLPVNFKSFTATKTNGATTLKWTTSTEINNKGFYVQRFYNGQWENIMYIATKAEGGNSSADLNYSYDDNFNFKGVAQYRILQVDIDGKSKYSMVRSVSNGSQAGRISVYPNPAPSNANVSIVLGDASSTYDIQIVDNSGRIVKEFSAVRNTQQISNLPKGQYLARVKQRESNQVSVEKFIVQ